MKTLSLVEEPTLATLEVSLSDNPESSSGNASIAFDYYCYEIEADTPWFIYHGPKIKIPKQESPVTICTADTIGTIRSGRPYWVLFDSGSNVSMIKISALPNSIITKLLGDTKLVRTLAGCLKTQEDIKMQDLRLPKFDKNRWINRQNVLVSDNHNVKYDIILGTHFLSKTGIKLNYSEGNMEWFDCSFPLCPPGGLNSKEFDAMEDIFHIQVEDELVRWRLAQMLCNRDPGRQVWKDRCSWGCERTHSSKCTSKSRFALSSTGEQKDVWWNSWHLPT